MDKNELLKKISEEKDLNGLKLLLEQLLHTVLHFYLIDDGSFSDFTEIVNVSKDRPIHIPTVEVDGLNYGVLYLNKETAIASKEDRYKMAYLR